MPSLTILSPFTGRVIPIEQVPDVVFAEKLVGDGLAVELADGQVTAPCDGELAVFVGSGHAFAMRAADLEIIVHIGLDTVKLGGRGFEQLAQVGTQVQAGQAVAQADLETIRAAGYSLISPVVIANLPESTRLVKVPANSQVRAGVDLLFSVEL